VLSAWSFFWIERASGWVLTPPGILTRTQPEALYWKISPSRPQYGPVLRINATTWEARTLPLPERSVSLRLSAWGLIPLAFMGGVPPSEPPLTTTQMRAFSIYELFPIVPINFPSMHVFWKSHPQSVRDFPILLWVKRNNPHRYYFSFSMLLYWHSAIF